MFELKKEQLSPKSRFPSLLTILSAVYFLAFLYGIQRYYEFLLDKFTNSDGTSFNITVVLLSGFTVIIGVQQLFYYVLYRNNFPFFE